MTEPHGPWPAEQVSYPGGKNGMWRASCAAGDYTSPFCTTKAKANAAVAQHIASKTSTDDEKMVALYHAVKAHESFETAAAMLVDILRAAQEKAPGKPRHLFLDIDGHRNSAGGWDHDMFELQRHFVMEFLGPYLSRITTPLISVVTKGQIDEVPDEIQIQPLAVE